MSRFIVAAVCLCLISAITVAALPVPLGEIEIGLESYDGYQEGMAYLSIDESGESLEILISYKGFGLDTVTWTFGSDDLVLVRGSMAQAAWWRSRLLEMDVDQVIIREMADLAPSLMYSYRGTTFPFDSSENVLRFVRQGRDYSVLLTEKTPGAETRRSGEKTLPVLTMHFKGKELPGLRDMLSEENVAAVLEDYAMQKSAIEAILSSGPDSNDS